MTPSPLSLTNLQEVTPSPLSLTNLQEVTPSPLTDRIIYTSAYHGLVLSVDVSIREFVLFSSIKDCTKKEEGW